MKFIGMKLEKKAVNEERIYLHVWESVKNGKIKYVRSSYLYRFYNDIWKKIKNSERLGFCHKKALYLSWKRAGAYGLSCRISFVLQWYFRYFINYQINVYVFSIMLSILFISLFMLFTIFFILFFLLVYPFSFHSLILIKWKC